MRFAINNKKFSAAADLKAYREQTSCLKKKNLCYIVAIMDTNKLEQKES